VGLHEDIVQLKHMNRLLPQADVIMIWYLCLLVINCCCVSHFYGNIVKFDVFALVAVSTGD